MKLIKSMTLIIPGIGILFVLIVIAIMFVATQATSHALDTFYPPALR